MKDDKNSIEIQDSKEYPSPIQNAKYDPSSPPPIQQWCNNFTDMLMEKNRRYGDSILQMLNIFAKHTEQFENPATKNILVRIDEKLKRILNADELRDNDVMDIAGYIALLFVSEGKFDESFFKQFLD